jgi:hypothetical protein
MDLAELRETIRANFLRLMRAIRIWLACERG